VRPVGDGGQDVHLADRSICGRALTGGMDGSGGASGPRIESR